MSKALRDELDIVRERASKVDRLEAELNRYKDKLNDIDYYKARLEELREDNRLLEETKSILEGQLENARQRTDLVLDLEGEILNYKSQLNNLLVEKEADKERIKKLVEENAHWQLCTKNCLSESASLVAELDSLRTHNASPNKDSLGQQMSTADLQAKFHFSNPTQPTQPTNQSINQSSNHPINQSSNQSSDIKIIELINLIRG